MIKTTVKYEGSLRCSTEHTESGAVVVTNAPRDHHGNSASFLPSELLPVSLGSCILSIMGIMARSLEVDITGASAVVEKQMANAPRRIARVFTVSFHTEGLDRSIFCRGGPVASEPCMVR